MSTQTKQPPASSTPPLTADQAARQALQALPRTRKLEIFIQLCQQGHNTASALAQSGLLADTHVLGYNPAAPDAEIEIEELFYSRCAATIDQSRPAWPHAVIPDAIFNGTEQPTAPAGKQPAKPYQKLPGDISLSQLYALVDWLYFVRAMPLKAIGAALRLDVKQVFSIKAELSSEFSSAIRRAGADSFIGDLVRVKDLLRADLVTRRNQLGPRDAQAVVAIDKLLWELENRFIDRLQEIGLIDKSLGKVDVHETWHVTIGPAGQPINTKVKELDSGLINHTDNSDPWIDVEPGVEPGTAASQPPATGPSFADGELTPEQVLATAANNQATIQVGGDYEGSD